MKTFFYRLYQLVVALPLGLLATLITALTTAAGCSMGDGHVWGYYPGRYWSKFIIRLLLLPVKVEGRENLQPGQSYVFVANHQGAIDIFLIYGYLGRNFKWMLKRALRKMPFVGYACQKAKFIFVDKSSPSAVRHTYEQARQTLQDGMSLVVFAEGERTLTGKMGPFKKGAFRLADELQLPIVPLTLNGPYKVLPRSKGFNFVNRHPLTLTIHKPIMPEGQGRADIRDLMERSRQIIASALR